MGEKIRIDKLLANMGKGSRNEVRDALKYGLVKVNDVVVKTGKIKIDADEDIVTYRNERVVYKKHVYIMLNKPSGYISATEDKRHKTVLELLGDDFSNYDLFPVGRLDIDTEGLLLITNDGELAHNLLAPKKHVPKTYYAKINASVDEEDIAKFKLGISLDDGYKCKPADLVVISSDKDRAEIMLTIYEGKFHQVKRMFEAIGKSVVYLKRISMGSLRLDEELKLSGYRELKNEELNTLIEETSL